MDLQEVDVAQMKNSIADLAISSAKSSFDEPLHVGHPNTGNLHRFFERNGAILHRRIVTNRRPHVQEFDNRVAEMLGAKHCVAVCNGSVAREIALRALVLKGEVMVPCFCYPHGRLAVCRTELLPRLEPIFVEGVH